MELSQEQVDKNYEEYITLLTNNVKREGIDNLIKWLNAKDTRVAPASAKYHLCCKGGLIKHSLNVYSRLKKLLALEYPNNDCPYSEETIALVGLLHDISKVNYYETEYRNVKVYSENGSKYDEKGNFDWQSIESYKVKEEGRLVFGSHCMNSLYMVSKFLKLNYQEELAILYHMGALDGTDDKITVKNTAEVFQASPLALLLHTADMCATFIDERETSNE